MPIKPETFQLYLHRMLIETGTAGGEGTDAALAAGFQEIYTIEAHPEIFHRAAVRYGHTPNVHTLFGPSPENLLGLLASVHEPVTFWLDAHSSGANSAGIWSCPLMDELRVIAHHDIKTHTILIDDVHLFGHELPGMAEVQQRLADINPDYQLSLAPSHTPELGMDILVAQV